MVAHHPGTFFIRTPRTGCKRPLPLTKHPETRIIRQPSHSRPCRLRPADTCPAGRSVFFGSFLAFSHWRRQKRLRHTAREKRSVPVRPPLSGGDDGGFSYPTRARSLFTKQVMQPAFSLDIPRPLWLADCTVLLTPNTGGNATRQHGAFLCPFSIVRLLSGGVSRAFLASFSMPGVAVMSRASA